MLNTSNVVMEISITEIPAEIVTYIHNIPGICDKPLKINCTAHNRLGLVDNSGLRIAWNFLYMSL